MSTEQERKIAEKFFKQGYVRALLHFSGFKPEDYKRLIKFAEDAWREELKQIANAAPGKPPEPAPAT